MPFNTEVLADNPTGYWRFNETSGTSFADSSGNNKSMTLGGGSPNQTGIVDKAVSVNSGVSLWTSGFTYTTADVFAAEFIVKRNSLSAGVGLLNNDTNDTNRWQIAINSAGFVNIRAMNSTLICRSTTQIEDTNYHHIVVTKNGSDVKIYIDGVDRSGAVTNHTFTTTTNQLWTTGQDQAANFINGNGTYDEIAFYNGQVLSSARVQAHYNASGITGGGGTTSMPTRISSTINQGYSATGSISKPAATIQNDLILVTIINNATQAIPNYAGWIKLGSDINGLLRVTTYYKIAGASEPSSYSFNFVDSLDWNITLSVFRGASSVPISNFKSEIVTANANTSVTASSINVPDNNSLVIRTFGIGTYSGFSTPTGYTLVNQGAYSNANKGSYTFMKEQANSGASGSASGSNNNYNSVYVIHTIVISPTNVNTLPEDPTPFVINVKQNQGYSSAASITRPWCETNNLLMVHLTIDHSQSGTFLPNTPTGWVEKDRISSGNISTVTFYKIITTTEPTSYSFGIGASTYWSVIATSYGNVDTDNPVSNFVEQGYYPAISANQPVTASSINVPDNNSLIVRIFGIGTYSGFTYPSDYSQLAQSAYSNANSGQLLFVKKQTVSGLSGNMVISNNNYNSVYNIHSFVLNPANNPNSNLNLSYSPIKYKGRGLNALSNINQTSLSCGVHANTMVGDFLLAVVNYETATQQAPIAPSGWTLYKPVEYNFDTTVGSRFAQAIYYKFRASGDASTYTWSFGSVCKLLQIGIFTYSGVNSANPLDSSAPATIKSSTTPYESPAITTVTPNAYLVRITSMHDGNENSLIEIARLAEYNEYSDYGNSFSGDSTYSASYLKLHTQDTIKDIPGTDAKKTLTPSRLGVPHIANVIALRPSSTIINENASPAYIAIDSSSDDETRVAVSTTYGGGTFTSDVTNNLLEASRNLEGSNHVIRNIHLRFPTGQIPDNAQIQSITLRVRTDTVDNDDNRSLVAEWNEVGNTSFNNKINAPISSDLRYAGSVNFNNDNQTTSANSIFDFPLLKGNDYINKTGDTVLTLMISGGAATGFNYFKIGSFDNPNYKEAQLIIYYTVPNPSTDYTNAVKADSPINYWKLEETTGNFINSGTHSSYPLNDSGHTPAVTRDINGAFSGSKGILINTGSIAGFLQAPTIGASLGDQFTVEAWVKRGSTAVAHPIFSRPSITAPSIYIKPTGQVTLKRYNVANSDIISSKIGITDTNWHHIAVTKNGSSIKIYIDGIDQTGTLISNYTFATLASTSPVYWGYGDYGSTTATLATNTMSLDELVYHFAALPPDRILAHYLASGKTVSGPPVTSAVNIYMSNDGSNYSLLKSLPNPRTSGWTTDVVPTGLGAPATPTLTVDSLIEKTITLNWVNPGNIGSRRWFKVSNVVNGVESALTPSRDAVATPSVVKYILERKNEGQADSFFTKIYEGDATGYTDTNVVFGQNYVYRISAVNSTGQVGPSSTKTANSGLPYSPTFTSAIVLDNESGSQFVRVAGGKYDGATLIEVQRSTDSGSNWVVLKNATIGTPPGGTNEQWWAEDLSPFTLPPSVAVWNLISQPVDTDGVHLRWNHAPNTPSNLSYRAFRKINGVSSLSSEVRNVSIQPTIKRYDIQRRETPVPGVPLTPANNWVTISSNNATSQNPIPLNTYDDNDVSLSKVYDYRIIAVNNFNQSSSPSIIRTLSTFDAPPPPPPPPPPIGGTIVNARPNGLVDIVGEGLIRVVWDYTHPTNEPQAAYILRAEYVDDNGITQTRWWNGSIWATNNATVVNSSNNFADLQPSIFTSGTRVDLYLEVISANGGRSNIYGE